MKFIRDLMSRKPKDTPRAPVAAEPAVEPFQDVIGYGEDALAEEPAPAPAPMPRSAKIEVNDVDVAEKAAKAEKAVEQESDEILEKLSSRLNDNVDVAVSAATAGVNIWDIEDENDTVEALAPVAPTPAPAAPAAPATEAAPAPRRRRNATRVLGFDAGSVDVVSMFDEAPKTVTAERTQFPVGWIIVDEGPGRGECFTLEAGMSQIGRGEDQAVQLDFGDNSISRTNHAAIVYDTDSHTFSLGHGGKKNIVRLNGKPVISNEKLAVGDKIKIGETTLHFVPLCSEDFNWADNGDDEENDNVAIA